MTTPIGVVPLQVFGERNIKVLLKKSHTNSIKIDLRNVILLEIQYTMDLFCNSKLVEMIYKSKKNMRLQSNRGKMLITHKEQVDGYKPHV